MPNEHAFIINKKYQEELQRLQLAMQAELASIPKSDWLRHTKIKRADPTSYFSDKQLKRRETTWTLLLQVGIKFKHYTDTLPNCPEKNLAATILALLEKLWNKTTSFNSNDQQAFIQSLSNWLASDTFLGNEKNHCEFLIAFCLFSHSLEILLSALSRIEKTFMTDSMLKLFEAMMSLSKKASVNCQQLIERFPELNQPEKISVTSENAGQILLDQTTSAIRALDKTGQALHESAQQIYQQLPILIKLAALFSVPDKESVKQFFQQITSKDELVCYLNALCIPQSEHDSWLTTFSSFNDTSWSTQARYLWGGVSVTAEKMQALLTAAINSHFTRLNIDQPTTDKQPSEKISILKMAISTQSYLLKIKEQRELMLAIGNVSKHFTFSMPELHLKKQSRFSFHLSNKKAIKQRLSVVTCELGASKRQLELVLQKAITWKKHAEQLETLINNPLLSDKQRETLLNTYKAGIYSAHRVCNLENVASVNHQVLIDQMIADFKNKIRVLSDNIDMFEKQLGALVELDLSYLQSLVCFMAVIDEEEIASLSQSFSSIRAKLFYCLANAWNEEKQTFTNLDVIFQSFNRELKKQEPVGELFSKEKMTFFAEKITAHNHQLSITKGNGALTFK